VNECKYIRILALGAYGADAINISGGTLAKYRATGAEVMLGLAHLQRQIT